MLDDADRHAALLRDGFDDADKVFRLVGVQARHDLVQEQDFRFVGQSAGDLHFFHFEYGEARCLAFQILQAEGRAEFGGAPAGGGKAQAPGENAADHNIFNKVEVFKGMYELVGTRYAEPRPPVGRHPGDVLPLELDPPGSGQDDARNEGDEGGLPRPVRSYDAEYLPGGHGKGNVVHGDEALEALGEPFGLQRGHELFLPPRARPYRPLGMNNMTMMMMIP